ncbi:MAG TPA: hypothetical protein VKU00_34275 [Chthonomonadaceae bacterium]|nr:hypothetical protein [Chthonomonadaceae bacterium]
MFLRRVIGWFVILALALFAVGARADVNFKTVSEMESLEGDKETISGPFPGILVTPHKDLNVQDSKYAQPYHSVCTVYVTQRSSKSDTIHGYGRRFQVFVPDRASLPLAKRVARLLLLLWGENHEHLRFDHTADFPTINVWLTREIASGLSPDTGGEQFEHEIYLYAIFRDRSPTEWAREIAHEYGHYALPGISGFTAPEEWANGVLGERLFLKWIGEDLKAGRLHAGDLTFITPDQLETYLALQVTPLVRRIVHEGIKAQEMAKRDAEGMDYYTGAALGIDTLYGSRMLLSAMSLTHSPDSTRLAQAPDFLRGFLEALRSADTFTVTVPFGSKDSTSETLALYLPRGQYTLSSEGPLKGWKLAEDGSGVHVQGSDRLSVGKPNWVKLTATRTPSDETPVRLTFRRKEAP